MNSSLATTAAWRLLLAGLASMLRRGKTHPSRLCEYHDRNNTDPHLILPSSVDLLVDGWTTGRVVMDQPCNCLRYFDGYTGEF